MSQGATVLADQMGRLVAIFGENEMPRITVADAKRDFVNLVDRVYSEGISVDLERDEKVIARITPAGPSSPLRVRDLNAFLRALPKLGDDAEPFSDDVRAVRRLFPAEADPWD